MSDEPYMATSPDGTVFLHRRSLPDRLRYLAAKLRDGTDPAVVATVLDVTAQELDGPGETEKR